MSASQYEDIVDQELETRDHDTAFFERHHFYLWGRYMHPRRSIEA